MIISKNRSVFLLWPNIVGYIRIIFLFIGVFTLRDHLVFGYIFYLLSALLDSVDGYLARILNQKSKFGMILDYSIDRFSTIIYLFSLTLFYPEYWGIFSLLASLDIASHLFHLFLSQSEGRMSHKEVDRDEGYLLKLYYTNRAVLFGTCCSYDMFFSSLLLYQAFPSSYVIFAAFIIFTPGFLFKIYVHMMMLINASRRICKNDIYENRINHHYTREISESAMKN